jgi:cytidylate kinase
LSPVSALALIGPPGAGKSSVLDALATRLEIAAVRHGAIESEELARGFPLLPGTKWAAQLAAALELQRAAGRHLFLIAATIESVEELREIQAATGADRSFVVCLTAAAEVLAERLQSREPDRWPGKRKLIAHARKLAATIPDLDGIDLVIDTDEREADDVAAQIHGDMMTRGLVTPQPEA